MFFLAKKTHIFPNSTYSKGRHDHQTFLFTTDRRRSRQIRPPRLLPPQPISGGATWAKPVGGRPGSTRPAEREGRKEQAEGSFLWTHLRGKGKGREAGGSRGKSRRKVSCTVPSMAEKMALTAKLTFQPNGLELEGKAGEK